MHKAGLKNVSLFFCFGLIRETETADVSLSLRPRMPVCAIGLNKPVPKRGTV